MYFLSLGLYMKIKIFKLLKTYCFSLFDFFNWIGCRFLSEINAKKQCHHFNQSLVDMFLNISSKSRRLIKLLLKPTDTNKIALRVITTLNERFQEARR